MIQQFNGKQQTAGDYERSSIRRRDHVAVQEQGLDLIRNLVQGDGASEIIDLVFREFGQEKLFEILTDLLRPHTDESSRGRMPLRGGGLSYIPQHTEIIISVLFVLVHIATGLPRHRQQLISQTELLQLVVSLFSHLNGEVRVACVWIVINLTWTDNASDQTSARRSALELEKLGVMDKLYYLESDSVLDVRERSKAAIGQMKELLR